MPEKLIVIGGVGGGATAAARARRLDEKMHIIVFERGEYISFANCGLPYHVGDIIRSRDDLLVTDAESFSRRYRIDVRTFSEVTAIDRNRMEVLVINHRTGGEYRESYEKIILSPGAEPIRPPVRGIDNGRIFTLRNIPDTEKICEYLDKRKPASAVIVGGGFIGLEMAENLIIRGVQTSIVEKMDQVMMPLDFEMASLVHEHLREKGVQCILGDGVESFEEKGDSLIVKTGKGNAIETDMVILSVGIRPEAGLAENAGLKTGGHGGIVVDDGMRTSDPDIFAVGDAVEIRHWITGDASLIPLAGPANKQARVAADNAAGRASVFRGSLGTSAVKVFDLTVATTGVNEKILRKLDMPYLASHTHSGSNAGYYPGSEMMALKLVFMPGTGRLLGAQGVGRQGVDKRMDVLAVATQAGMTVFDLQELDLCYAPPYGSAKDAVNIAGYVAANLIKGDVRNINWDELDKIDPEKEVLLDLRSSEEIAQTGTLDDAVHIPIDDLRDRMGELDRRKTYLPFCAVGMRGYLGYRILVQHGFRARNLSGGLRTLP